MSLYLGENLISGQTTLVGESRNIGQIIPSTIPLTDAGLHLLDGALIQGDGIYSAFVTHMAAISETNPELFCTEQEWQQSVTQYGVCGKFVYDSTNNTLRLQKFYSAERYLIASHSSGTEWYRVYSDGWCEQGGELTSVPQDTTVTVNFLKPYVNTNYSVLIVATGGSRSSTQYMNGESVQSRSVDSFVMRTNDYTFGRIWETCGYTDISTYINQTQYQYIVIATSTKTDIEVDIDEIATDLNGKADVDGSNMINSVKNFDGSWINFSQLITLSTATAVGEYTLDLSPYLPNDNYNYDVKILFYCYKSASNEYHYNFYNDIFPQASGSWGYVNSYVRANTMCFDIPVSNQRYIIYKVTQNAADNVYVQAVGYRRIGTNQ